MLKTVIIDDEKLSREVLCNYITEYCTEIEVVATASSVKSGFKAIRKYNPDFIFLDIEIADGKGFDLLKMFDKISFRVIFVTAFSEYAVKAFRFSAVDYLLKPVKIDELVSAVEKIKTISLTASGNDYFGSIIKNLDLRATSHQTLVIPNLKGFEVIRVPDILMCQADGYCTVFYVQGDKKYVSSKNLKHFEELLETSRIIRVHHSYLVNLDHVKSYSRQGEILLTDNMKAYLGDSYKNTFLKMFTSR